MDLHSLVYFLKVAELESITKAAEHFNITQPAMSKAITQLEWKLGAPLFDRVDKRMYINERGKILAKSVSNSLKQLDDGINKIKFMANTPSGLISIATYAATNIISECMSAYSKINPSVRFKLLGTRTLEAKTQCDLLFFADHMQIDGVESIPIIKEKFVAIVHKDHPLADRTEIDLIELKNDRFVFYSGGMNAKYHDYTYKLCLDSGFAPNAVYETDNTSIKPELVASGAAVSIVPEICVKDHKRAFPTMAFLPLRTPDYKRTIYLGWKKDNYLSEAARSFKNFAVEYYKDFANKYNLLQ